MSEAAHTGATPWLVGPSSRVLSAIILAALTLLGLLKVIQVYEAEYVATGADTIWRVLSDPRAWMEGHSLVVLSWLVSAVMLWHSHASETATSAHARADSPFLPTCAAATALGLLAGAASVGWTLLVTSPFDRALDALLGYRGAQNISFAFVTGPIDEEPLKLLAVLLILALLARRGFSPWLAAVVGIAVGEGFALVEDVAYLMNTGLAHPYSTFEGAQQSFTARNAFPNVGHWLCTAVAGVGVAALLGSQPLPSVCANVYATPQRRVRWGQLCIAAAIAGHALWNYTPSIALISLACLMPFILAALGHVARILR